MKDLYQWHFPLGAGEITDAWTSGILSVDTNVLLDLYRYHEETRNLLLQALEYFGDRTWLANQVAEEFFRNRNSVIASASSGFTSADKIADEILKQTGEETAKLAKNRIIPQASVSKLQMDIQQAVNAFKLELSKTKEAFPNFRDNDLIIDRVCGLFNSRVGKPYDKTALEEALKEAKKRFESETPPGYKDIAEKKGDRRYGDYLIWRQLIDYAGGLKLPLIFVTSELKEDWWERASGKTIGPRQELLKEYFEATGRRLLFYQTDRFLEFASDRIGSTDVAEAVEEIRDVARRRTRNPQLVEFIEQDWEWEEGETWQRGTLVVRLLRPAFNFTCSGRLEPHMLKIPDLTVALKIFPEGMPEHVVRFGTGTTYDFNIHVKSTDYGDYLPIGEYRFFYDAINDLTTPPEAEI